MPGEQPAARLLLALERRDELALTAILHPAVRLVVDTGDRTGGRASGRDRVARTLLERLTRHPDASLEAVNVNGKSGLAVRSAGGAVIAVLAVEARSGAWGGRGDAGDRVTELWWSSAPEKLTHWNPRPHAPE